MTAVKELRLAAPGAGLPAIELLIAKLIFSHKLRTESREDWSARFGRERAEIRGLVDGCAAERRGERVLIKRLPGMEDSSRCWSVWMTLDHLRITNEAFARIIADLCAGRMPEGEASTAAVKPSPGAGKEVEASYERSCGGLLAAVEATAELRTAVRYAHPWFGPLDAAGWHALAALHMGIHRRQIGKICKGLQS